MIKTLRYYLITCLIVTLSIVKCKGQCIAEAGVITMGCDGDTIILGGSPTAINGTGELSYVWTTDHQSLTGHIFNASQFLNDTSVSNPIYINQWVGDSISFYLTVTDSLGVSCSDTINIMSSSPYLISLIDKTTYINYGESTWLYTSVGGGVPPLAYRWSPSAGMVDSSDVNTVVKPDSTVLYTLIVTDSLGCSVKDGMWVIVGPTGINELKNIDNLEVFPNPLTESSTIRAPVFEGQNLSVMFYNSAGNLVKKIDVAEGAMQIKRSEFDKGIYFFIVLNKSILVGQGKLKVE